MVNIFRNENSESLEILYGSYVQDASKMYGAAFSTEWFDVLGTRVWALHDPDGMMPNTTLILSSHGYVIEAHISDAVLVEATPAVTQLAITFERIAP